MNKGNRLTGYFQLPKTRKPANVTVPVLIILQMLWTMLMCRSSHGNEQSFLPH